uniref:Uncharacterized protein n=1 Tax=Cajanus cajan TaxID=3821 RepID=A0A151TY98_CAJCA|nr:hypothetical protein KK1_011336 [Cajanus cajan]
MGETKWPEKEGTRDKPSPIKKQIADREGGEPGGWVVGRKADDGGSEEKRRKIEEKRLERDTVRFAGVTGCWQTAANNGGRRWTTVDGGGRQSGIDPALARRLPYVAMASQAHGGSFPKGSWIGEMKQASDKTVIISEILDPRTKNLLSMSKISDYVLSNELVSMALAMVAEDRQINDVLEELFAEEGNEMHIRQADLYLCEGEELSFYEIMLRARQRREIVIGYRLANAERAVINPPAKTDRRKWSLKDVFVVAKKQCREASNDYSNGVKATLQEIATTLKMLRRENEEAKRRVEEFEHYNKRNKSSCVISHKSEKNTELNKREKK